MFFALCDESTCDEPTAGWNDRVESTGDETTGHPLYSMHTTKQQQT